MKQPSSPVRPPARAFTLMEMMLVLAIIALLIAVGAVTLRNIQEHAAIVAARGQLGSLKTAVGMYRTANRKFPQQLEELVKPPADALVKSPFADGQALVDPWGQKFQMRKPGKKSGEAIDLYSMGPNETDGDADDVYP